MGDDSDWFDREMLTPSQPVIMTVDDIRPGEHPFTEDRTIPPGEVIEFWEERGYIHDSGKRVGTKIVWTTDG